MKRLLAVLLLLVLLPAGFAQQGMGPGPGVKTYGGSDFVTDTFTEGGTGTVSLNTHVGEVGATWTGHPHANYGGGPLTLDVDVDRVYGTGTNASYTSGTPPSADYYVQANFCVQTVIAQSNGIAGRMDTTADTMYLARLVDGVNWQLRKIVAGAATTLGSTSSTGVPSAGNCATGKLTMTGDQISFSVTGSGTVIGPITDSAITAAGRAGIRNNGAVATATTGIHLDNFSAR